MMCGHSLRNDITANIVMSEEAARDLKLRPSRFWSFGQRRFFVFSITYTKH